MYIILLKKTMKKKNKKREAFLLFERVKEIEENFKST